MGMTNQLLADSGATFMAELKWLVVILVSIAGALCVLYAVYIGYLFATATDEGKRRAAKSRFIKVLSSALIIVAMAFALNAINLRFDTPDNGGNGTDPDNLLDGVQQAGTGFIYNKYDTPKIWIQAEKQVEVTIYAQYIEAGVGKKYNIAKFGGFTDFRFDVSESGFTNCYEDGPVVEIKNNGSTLVYHFQPPAQEDGEVIPIDHYMSPDMEGKYWRAYATFKYDDVPSTLECYIRIDDGDGYTWGQKIGEFGKYKY